MIESDINSLSTGKGEVLTLGEVSSLTFGKTLLALAGKNDRISVISAIGVTTESQCTAVEGEAQRM